MPQRRERRAARCGPFFSRERAMTQGGFARLLASAAVFLTFSATAQNYPARPVRVVIPQAPGGAVDVAWRPVAQKLSEVWGQQVVVDNRPGANGIIGMEA